MDMGVEADSGWVVGGWPGRGVRGGAPCGDDTVGWVAD